MKVRFYFSTTSLENHSLRIALPKVGYGVYEKDSSVMIAEAWLDGAYYYTTTNQELPHKNLRDSVTHMSCLTLEKNILTAGHYRGQGWEAVLTILYTNRTQVEITMTGCDVSKLKEVYQKLVTGQLLPAFVINDTQLTSEQVAAIVNGDGSREHWLNVVQSAQSMILKTAATIRALEEEIVGLKHQVEIMKPA